MKNRNRTIVIDFGDENQYQNFLAHAELLQSLCWPTFWQSGFK